MVGQKDNQLFNEFSPTSTQKWEEKIAIDLKGADYERKLVWRTLDGFNVKPYYRKEHLAGIDFIYQYPGEFPFLRGNKTTDNTWRIRQDIVVKNIEEANKKALSILMKGIDSLCFIFNEEELITEENIEKLLNDIELNCIELNFNAKYKNAQLIKIFADLMGKSSRDVSQISGSFNIDPIGSLTRNGNYCCGNQKESFECLKNSLNNSEILPHFQVININGAIFKDAGSSIVQELAFSLNVANDYMANLIELGFSADKIASKMRFNFDVGANYFMEIAKIRAARMLWAKIVEAYNPQDLKSAQMKIHATTSNWNKTVYDPYVNMLRLTTEAMSATIGGADSLTVQPFDKPYKESDEFSERIARNTQIILKEEAYFDKIIDPAGGSYYIENLTNSIIESAWDLFQKVENKGGYIEAFKQGFIQDEIKKTADKKDLNIATRKDNLLGTNQFPNFNEKLDNDISLDTLIGKQKIETEKAIAKPLIPYRASQAFEELRAKTDRSEKRPKVFMLTYGNLAMRKARANFACNFFACAGFEVIDNLGFKTIDDGINAALAQKADITVLCSSDAEYETIAPEVFEKLKDKSIVVLAGYPKDLVEKLKKTGMKHFIHIKSNVLETLQQFQKELNII